VRNVRARLSSMARVAIVGHEFLLEERSDTVPHIQCGSTAKSRFLTTYPQGLDTRLMAWAEAKRVGMFGRAMRLHVQDMMMSDALEEISTCGGGRWDDARERGG
jgi:hypothetical protein